MSRDFCCATARFEIPLLGQSLAYRCGMTSGVRCRYLSIKQQEKQAHIVKGQKVLNPRDPNSPM